MEFFFCSLEENSSRTNWSKYISIWFINKYKLLQRLHFLETIYDSLPNSISYLLSESLSGTEPSPSVLRLISKYCHKKGVFEEKRVLLRTIPFSYQDYCVFTSKKFLDFMIRYSPTKRRIILVTASRTSGSRPTDSRSRACCYGRCGNLRGICRPHSCSAIR